MTRTRRSGRQPARGIVTLLALATLGACSSGSAATTTPPRTYTATIARETVVAPSFRQGVARNGTGWVFSFNDGLYRTDDSFAITTTLQPAIPAEWKARGFDHIGDIDVVGDVLYAPLEQPDYATGRQAVLLYDARTLAYRSGRTIAQHENSFLTVDPSTHIAYSMDRFGGGALTRYDTAHGWRPLAPLRIRRHIDKVQGGDVRGGAIWLSTDDPTDAVYRVDLASGGVQRIGSIGHVDGEGEGIDATPTPSGDLHVLSIDVKIVPVRLVELKVSSTTRRG
jgi:hypothetical protein